MKKNLLFVFAALCVAACITACTPMPAAVINIGSAVQLANIQSNLDGKYKLTQNITVNNWLPLGDNAHPFKGDLDGNGHTITINSFADVTTSGDSDFYGLFGYIQGGRVFNLQIKGATLHKTSSKHIHYGGIVGCLNGGFIIQCVVNATLLGQTSGSGISSMVGGIVGSMLGQGVISDCYTIGGVQGASSNGTVNVGGIAGAFTNGTLRRCYATNAVSAIGSAPGKNVGGIVGYIGGSGPERSTVKACVALNSSVAAQTNPKTNVHKIVGSIASPAVTDLEDNYGHILTVTGTNPNGNNGGDGFHNAGWFWTGTVQWPSSIWNFASLPPKLKFSPVVW